MSTGRSTNFISPLFYHRQLILSLVFRRISSRYKGAIFGYLWITLVPLILLAVYTFVFSVIFSARWDVYIGEKTSFALFLFIGLCAHQMLAEVLSSSVGIIHENKSYVKKIQFPLEILAYVAVITALFSFVINSIIVLIANWIFFGTINAAVLYLPILILPLVFLCLGFSWIVSAIGVYFRDLRHIINVVILMFLFLTPIFYPLEAVPLEYASIIKINPMASIVENLRGLIFFNITPAIVPWLVLLVCSCLFAGGTYKLFNHARVGFADVI
jgi:lipopolysaccharide transport system permease protein